MSEVTLQKLKTHYFLSPADWAAQRKLDGLQLKVLDDSFALASDRAGLPQDGELCLRNVSVPVHLRLDSSEQSMSAHWTTTLAESIADAIRNGPGSQRVFYYSRPQAVFDFAVSVSRGDYERVWAWRLLGLWQGKPEADADNAIRQLVRALSRELHLIVPALRLIASQGYLPSLSRRLSTNDWLKLAESALIHAGVFVPAGVHDRPPSSRAFSYALRVLKRSQILAGIKSSESLAAADERTRDAVAGLVVMDAEPVLLYSKVATEVIAVIAKSLSGSESETKLPQAKPVTAPAAQKGATSLAPRPFEQPARQAVTDANLETGIAPDQPVRPPDWTSNIDESDLDFGAATTPENELPDRRERAATDCGGLLYLLNLIAFIDLPQQIVDDSALRSRPLAWTLHQLAMTLALVDANDAAALAFAGLSPGATPPSEEEPPADETETAALRSFAVRIVECLGSLLSDEYESSRALLDFVCRRRAEVVADPAWIEIRFSLDQVCTEIRRAGLDLDPGYVTWLGVVVKFVYE